MHIPRILSQMRTAVGKFILSPGSLLLQKIIDTYTTSPFHTFFSSDIAKQLFSNEQVATAQNALALTPSLRDFSVLINTCQKHKLDYNNTVPLCKPIDTLAELTSLNYTVERDSFRDSVTKLNYLRLADVTLLTFELANSVVKNEPNHLMIAKGFTLIYTVISSYMGYRVEYNNTKLIEDYVTALARVEECKISKCENQELTDLYNKYTSNLPTDEHPTFLSETVIRDIIDTWQDFIQYFYLPNTTPTMSAKLTGRAIKQALKYPIYSEEIKSANELSLAFHKELMEWITSLLENTKATNDNTSDQPDKSTCLVSDEGSEVAFLNLTCSTQELPPVLVGGDVGEL